MLLSEANVGLEKNMSLEKPFAFFFSFRVACHYVFRQRTHRVFHHHLVL